MKSSKIRMNGKFLLLASLGVLLALAGCSGQGFQGSGSGPDSVGGVSLEVLKAIRSELPCDPYGSAGQCHRLQVLLVNNGSAEFEGAYWTAVTEAGAVLSSSFVEGPVAVIPGGRAIFQIYVSSLDGTDFASVRAMSYSGAEMEVDVQGYGDASLLWEGSRIEYDGVESGQYCGECAQVNFRIIAGPHGFPEGLSLFSQEAYPYPVPLAEVPANDTATVSVNVLTSNLPVPVRLGTSRIAKTILVVTEDMVEGLPSATATDAGFTAVYLQAVRAAGAAGTSPVDAKLWTDTNRPFAGSAQLNLWRAPAIAPFGPTYTLQQEWGVVFTQANFTTDANGLTQLALEVPDAEPMFAYSLQVSVTTDSGQRYDSWANY